MDAAYAKGRVEEACLMVSRAPDRRFPTENCAYSAPETLILL